MKTIKVFLASSDELKDEREKFGNLIRRLDDIYIKRGIHVKLLVWEDMDPCYNNVRKQDEYNAWIRGSHFFVCLFYTKAGQYTMEELDVARTESAHRKEPKIMIYCRDLQDGDVEMADLADFKRTLDKELGHFWGHYSTTDKLHLDFVMFFMRTEEGNTDVLKLENGEVMFDDMHVAKMDNLPFASENEGYKDMQQRLQALSTEVNQLQDALQQAPGIEMLHTLHQQKMNEYNALKERFLKHQQALFNTAKRISEMQQEKISGELQRAIDEFETGHVEAANAILDGMRNQIGHYKEQIQREHAVGYEYIKALLLQTNTLMADVTIQMEERIQRTLKTFQEADELAELCVLPKIKYVSLLHHYCVFLNENRMHDDAIKVQKREQSMYEELYETFTSENEIVQKMRNEFEELPLIIEKMRKHLTQFPNDESTLDELQAMLNRYNELRDKLTEHQQNFISTASRISDMQSEDVSSRLQRAIDEFLSGHLVDAIAVLDGIEYETEQLFDQMDSHHNQIVHGIMNLQLKAKAIMIDASRPIDDRTKQAIEIYQKADKWAEACSLSKGKYAFLLSDYGDFLRTYGMYQESLEIYLKECKITESLYGNKHPNMATSYNNIGLVYAAIGKYYQALDYYKKALVIREENSGLEHPDLSLLYNNIGKVYCDLGKYSYALDSYNNALAINVRVLGVEHPVTATIYNNIGYVYEIMGDYAHALKAYKMAQEIREQVLGPEHPDTAQSYNNIGFIFASIKEYEQALDNYRRGQFILEKTYGRDHPETAKSYENIGRVYFNMGYFDQALMYYRKVLAIREKVFGEEHPDIAKSFNILGKVFELLGNYQQAHLYYERALLIGKKTLGTEHIDIAMLYNNIASLYFNYCDYEKSLEYYMAALSIIEKVFGEENGNTAQIYSHIGNIYHMIGNNTKAKEYQKKAQRKIQKTIKVFLASSEELREERCKLGDLVHRLDDIFEKRGIQIKLLTWENIDAAYDSTRYMKDYEECVRQCDIFVCMFYTKVGPFTFEQLNVAITEMTQHNKPRILIYCRDLQDGDIESAELIELKRRFVDEWGYYPNSYSTTDKLHLSFVLNFVHTIEELSDSLATENVKSD